MIPASYCWTDFAASGCSLGGVAGLLGISASLCPPAAISYSCSNPSEGSPEYRMAQTAAGMLFRAVMA